MTHFPIDLPADWRDPPPRPLGRAAIILALIGSAVLGAGVTAALGAVWLASATGAL